MSEQDEGGGLEVTAEETSKVDAALGELVDLRAELASLQAQNSAGAAAEDERIRLEAIEREKAALLADIEFQKRIAAARGEAPAEPVEQPSPDVAPLAVPDVPDVPDPAPVEVAAKRSRARASDNSEATAPAEGKGE